MSAEMRTTCQHSDVAEYHIGWYVGVPAEATAAENAATLSMAGPCCVAGSPDFWYFIQPPLDTQGVQVAPSQSREISLREEEYGLTS